MISACILPFTPDLEIDEAAYRKDLRDVSSAGAVSAIAINAHACEVAPLTLDEQRRVLEITARTRRA